LASPATVIGRSGLASLSSTVAFVGAAAVGTAALSLLVSACNWVLGRWRGLVIRHTLGAPLHRLLAALAGELLALGTAGGVMGLLVGGGFATVLHHTWPRLLAHPQHITATLVAGVATTLAGLLSLGVVAGGLLWMMARAAPAARTDLQGDRVTGGRALLSVQASLAVVQVAGVLALTFSSALLLRTPAPEDHRPGLTYLDDTVTATLRLEGLVENTPPERARAYRLFLASGSPELQSARLALSSPGVWLGMGKALPVLAFCNQCFRGQFMVPVSSATVRVSAVSPGALSAVAGGALRGRDVSPVDTLGTAPVAVLNAPAARALFVGADPVGKSVHVGVTNRTSFQVVGTVNLPMPGGLGSGGAEPVMYVSLLQHPPEGVELSVAASAWTQVAALTDVMHEAGWRPVISAPQALAGQAADQREPLVWIGRLALAQALLAAVVAGLALWSVMAQTVTVRRREIGIRMAVGAGPRTIMDWVLRRAVIIAGAGLWIGLVGARWVWDLLGGNPLGSVAGALLLLVQLALAVVLITLLATWLPARRAAAVSPSVLWSGG
ncbi:MAG TPA: FtsX-like permease family protein, partial [Gemmatimonadales bacterium]|nr:FtsX-like permease family protein [Gemmatimonadales bacterium]